MANSRWKPYGGGSVGAHFETIVTVRCNRSSCHHEEEVTLSTVKNQGPLQCNACTRGTMGIVP